MRGYTSSGMPVKRTEPEEFEDQCAVPVESGFSVMAFCAQPLEKVKIRES